MEAFIDEWFTNPAWWFGADCKIDDYLTQRYECILDDKRLYESVDVPAIIVHDQLVRHVYRNQSANHIILYHLRMAVDKARAILLNRSIETLSVKELCFVGLPLRHAQLCKEVYGLLRHCWNRLDGLEKNCEDYLLLKRFMKATYQRLNTYVPECVEVFQDGDSVSVFDCERYTDILANKPNKDAIWDGTVAIDSRFRSAFENVLCDGMCATDLARNVIVSLSGGVDSMVALCITKQLEVLGYVNVYAVHVNYKNKATCDRDEEFLRKWCAYLEVPLCVRSINEIKRTPCMNHDMRNEYEDYTKRVRFDAYRYCWREIIGESTTVPCVVLGHNKDDCFENIMTNITYEQKMENLLGMKTAMVQDGICFMRPMLGIPKADIRAFAKFYYGVPHLHDSTPAWSQRGKIRDIVMPALRTWDERAIPALFKLSEYVSELEEVMSGIVDGMIERTIQSQFVVLKQNELKHPMSIWKAYFKRLFGHAGCPSNKSLSCFKERLDKWMKSDRSKACVVVLAKDLLVTIAASRNREGATSDAQFTFSRTPNFEPKIVVGGVGEINLTKLTNRLKP